VDASVGPAVSLGAGATVERATVRHSVIGEGARVADVPLLADSVLGRRAQVTGIGRGPQLLLGDDSVVELGNR
jgi:ADP-glucose pyrophosphorylase